MCGDGQGHWVGLGKLEVWETLALSFLHPMMGPASGPCCPGTWESWGWLCDTWR